MLRTTPPTSMQTLLLAPCCLAGTSTITAQVYSPDVLCCRPDVTIGGLHTLFAGLRGGLPEADFGEDQLHDLMAAGGGPTIHWFITSAAWALGVDGELALDWARLEWTALPAPVAELAE